MKASISTLKFQENLDELDEKIGDKEGDIEGQKETIKDDVDSLEPGDSAYGIRDELDTLDELLDDLETLKKDLEYDEEFKENVIELIGERAWDLGAILEAYDKDHDVNQLKDKLRICQLEDLIPFVDFKAYADNAERKDIVEYKGNEYLAVVVDFKAVEEFEAKLNSIPVSSHSVSGACPTPTFDVGI